MRWFFSCLTKCDEHLCLSEVASSANQNYNIQNILNATLSTGMSTSQIELPVFLQCSRYESFPPFHWFNSPTLLIKQQVQWQCLLALHFLALYSLTTNPLCFLELLYPCMGFDYWRCTCNFASIMYMWARPFTQLLKRLASFPGPTQLSVVVVQCLQ